jgi:hypothetical protein
VRCPNCDHNQQRKDGMVCGQCGYPFALDPKQSPNIADRRFARAVAKVSDDGTRWFSLEQLHGQLAKRLPGPAQAMIGAVVLGAIVAVFGIGFVAEADRFETITGAVLTFVVASAAIGIVAVGWRLARRPPPLERTSQLVARWQAAGKPLDRLLQQPGLERPPPAAPERDIFDYGAEAVLIVDDDLAVDLLVANGFARTNRCLVVSTSGYPSRVAEHAAALLAAAPATPAGVVHASGNIGALGEATARYGPGVVDLGLSTDTVRNLAALRWARREASVPVRALPHRVLAAALPVALTTRTSVGDLFAAAHRGELDADVGDFG